MGVYSARVALSRRRFYIALASIFLRSLRVDVRIRTLRQFEFIEFAMADPAASAVSKIAIVTKIATSRNVSLPWNL
jgi:hypothetical protein